MLPDGPTRPSHFPWPSLNRMFLSIQPNYRVVVSAVLRIFLSFSIVSGQENRPDVYEVLKSRRDVWGELAIRSLDGPTYEYYESLLPPLRYVETRERHYPIRLSKPNGWTFN